MNLKKKINSSKKYNNKQRIKICSDLFILESLWPFLHKISKATKNLKDVLDQFINLTKKEKENDININDKISNIQIEIDEIVSFMDLSLRLFFSINPFDDDDDDGDYIHNALIQNLMIMMNWI